MIQPSLAGLVPLVQDNPALGSAKHRTVLGYIQASLRDSPTHYLGWGTISRMT